MKAVTILNIVGSGMLSEKFLSDIKRNDFTIGVDRGAAWLLQHKITPDVAIGDFDSVTRKEFANIRTLIKTVKRYPKDKDLTDMELAIQYALKKNPQEVVIYGGSGTRSDHTLGTLHLLEHFLRAGIRCRFLDEHNDIRLLAERQEMVKGPFRYMSILPFSESATISLRGFLYSVSRLLLKRGQTRGISNEFLGKKGIVNVHKGIAWVIQSRD